MASKFYPVGPIHAKGFWRLQEERIKSGRHRRWRICQVSEAGTEVRNMLVSTDDMEDLADLMDKMLDFVERNPKRGVSG